MKLSHILLVISTVVLILILKAVNQEHQLLLQKNQHKHEGDMLDKKNQHEIDMKKVTLLSDTTGKFIGQLPKLLSFIPV